MVWIPKRTMAECHAIMTAKGMPWEIETRLIKGKVQRVYKNLQPSLRDFWLDIAPQHKEQTYVVCGQERLSYGTAFEQSLKVATVFERVYGIQKGDRVAICARNIPEYLVAWWACHLLGAVAVLVNAWLPLEPLVHCVKTTGAKLLLLDEERANCLHPAADAVRSTGVSSVIVFSNAPATKWSGFERWKDVLSADGGDPRTIVTRDLKMDPEDNATIIFTSGTTGLPKGVLSTQRQYLTNLRNAAVAAVRSILRKGGNLPPPYNGPQRGLLLSVPFFHVTGSTSLMMLASSQGSKLVLMRKWEPKEAARLIKAENVRIAGGVPSMVSDLLDVVGPDALDSLLFGGAAAPEQLPGKALAAFPNTISGQGYGMTETNSVAVSIAGEDYAHRPTTVGVPCMVNDVVIMRDGVVQPPGSVGEIWIRGPDVMECYWNDPEATKKTITEDGWIRTGDSGEMDAEGFIYLHDRIKDLIIRGGENIPSVTVENALYHDERVNEVAAVGIPDEKLGEVVAAIVVTKSEHHGKVKESELIELARTKLPYFAVPVMVIVRTEPLDLTPSAKVLKAPLRALARAEWERRKSVTAGKLPAKL
ncbi:hypothetical protein BDY19DRAFT_501652 [Irpex rosettiformis]|uniref:Uncharacterized protein n=1 Tax=Irpex rosettiformis TaxID=378272 RepID=A0ACB8UEM8_9APHY|nr:hypothetical protein BDY19DRAFT_501652 [Irpex rosettiformis]